MRRAAGRHIAVLGALAAVLSAGCSDEPAGTGERPTIFASGADQVMLGVEHYLTRDGIRRGLLSADTAFTFDDGTRIELRRLEIHFFDEAGAERGVLTSESGVYQLDSGNMTVYESVELQGRLQAASPSLLETDSLVYEASENELSTGAPWTLTHPDGTVERGRGLVTDPALQNIRARDWAVETPDVEVPQ